MSIMFSVWAYVFVCVCVSCRLTDEQTAEIIQLQATAKRLSEEAVDRTEMMNSMQNDKETISRYGHHDSYNHSNNCITN